MTIKVMIKHRYGNQHIYPVCKKAMVFAQLVKQKTLTRADINSIKELGYTVQVVPEVAVL